MDHDHDNRMIVSAIRALDPDARRRVLRGALDDIEVEIARLEHRQAQIRRRMRELEVGPDDDPGPIAA